MRIEQALNYFETTSMIPDDIGVRDDQWSNGLLEFHWKYWKGRLVLLAYEGILVQECHPRRFETH